MAEEGRASSSPSLQIASRAKKETAGRRTAYLVRIHGGFKGREAGGLVAALCLSDALNSGRVVSPHRPVRPMLAEEGYRKVGQR